MWWASLSAAEHVFYIIAIVSSAILVIQLILSLIGLAGHDVNMDGIPDFLQGVHDFSGFDVDHPDLGTHDTGLGLISIRTVLAFLVGFGWTGVVMLGMDASVPLSVIGATIVGAIFMFVIFSLIRLIYGLADSGNIDIANAVGEAGTVYIPIPSKGQGSGQVQVIVQGRLRELPAITEETERLATGTHVRVVKVVSGDTLLVERVTVSED